MKKNKIGNPYETTKSKMPITEKLVVSDIEPFVFIVKIKKSNSITITEISIQGTNASESDLKVDGDYITATIRAFVATSSFLLSISANGTPFSETTFNLTCDGLKVFPEDQKIKIESSNRGGYLNNSVKIP